jgi:hypothetical protein
MANPRKLIDHLGIAPVALTFLSDGSTIAFSRTAAGGSTAVGLAVGLVAGTEDTVELVADAQAVLGRLIVVEADGACVVQVGGVAEFRAGNAVTLLRGGRLVGALGAASARGYVRPPATATPAEVNAARHTVLKIADPTKAQTYLSQ